MIRKKATKSIALVICASSCCFPIRALESAAVPSAPNAGVEQTNSSTNTSEGMTARMDRYHEDISEKVGGYVYGMDCLLAGYRVAEIPTGSWIRIIPRVEVEEGKGLSVGASFKSKIILPHLHDRLALIADNIPRTLLPGRDIDPGQYDTVNAGLRLKVVRTQLSAINLDGGINLNPWPSPFVSTTLRHLFVWDQAWNLELSQEFFLYVDDDGFGEMSQVELTRILSADSFIRAISAGTWSEESLGLEWEQTFLLCKALSNFRSFETSFSLFGHKESAGIMDNYRLNCTYRWNAFRPWLFFSITPQIAFPNDRDFQCTPLLRFCMEITCGDF